MTSTPEARVKASVTKILKEFGAYYFYPMTGGFGRSGVPDIICCYRGFFIAIECKAGKNKPTALQEREMGKVNGAGGMAILINEDNVHVVRSVLEEFKKS
jgi:Holliday junction resolvase